jgi:hypothetical protein
MAAIGRTRASLRVLGDTLEPEEVSALLGRQPTRQRRKGEAIEGKSASLAPTGAWILDSTLSERVELEEHIEILLGSLSSDLDEWASLTDRFSASLLCSLFLDQYNEGFELSPRVTRALAERGIVIALDIYSGDPDA